MTETKIIAVLRRSKTIQGQEIGQKLGSIYRYRVSIYILVSSADFDTAVNDLDSLEKKVIKNISLNSNLSTLVDTEEGHTERVMKYNIVGTDYPEKLPPFDTTVLSAIIEVEVDTELHPS